MKIVITKILDIDHNFFGKDMIKALAACECYTDNKTVQHLYNSFDILEGEPFEGLFTDTQRAKIHSIEELCVQNECDYFRITY